VILCAYIVMMNLGVGSSTAQDVVIPREGTDASTVASQTAQLSGLIAVPNLHLSSRRPNT
jgi:hypothetical protein